MLFLCELYYFTKLFVFDKMVIKCFFNWIFYKNIYIHINSY